MRNVVVAGVGMTPFARHTNGVRQLTEEAVHGALGDAGAEPAGIQAVYFANAVSGIITGQEMIRGQAALRNTGLSGLPIVNVENACASASTAFHLAWASVAYGQYDAVLAVGAEKLSHPEKARTFRAIGSAVDLEWLDEVMGKLNRPGQDSAKSGAGQDHSLFMEFYSIAAQAYMSRSGATREDFADVAVKNRRHASMNPLAQYRELITREEVLSSREVASVLTLLMCSPIGDGAAAALVCSEQAARGLGVTEPVFVRASVLVTGKQRQPGEPEAVERAARHAYEVAGVGPEEIDVVELHDAAAPAELMLYEELGLCGPAEGPALLAKGDTAIGGRCPVNPSGGLLSKGHPIGATGLAQITEVTQQLRGRAGERQAVGARVGLTENAGGFLGLEPAAVCINVLSR